MKLHKIDKYTATTTVGELVAELLKHNQSSPVLTEGCDYCSGNVTDVSVEKSGVILIKGDDAINVMPVEDHNEILTLREALKTLLDVFERCEAGFQPEIELRFLARDLAKSALTHTDDA